MRIVMLTNTYFPHVGGVARSVESFAKALRERGHQVMVIAPEFPGVPEREVDVVRVPAIQRFNGSDFSVRLPVPGLLDEPLDRFQPEIVHSHHPFLLGDTALRIASGRGLPLLFTHHTLYEEYTHYVAGPGSPGSETLRRFVIDLSTGFANLCDHVIAPSQSIATLLQQRGVTSPVTVVPTGVELSRFERCSGKRFRAKMGIPANAFVVGHTGRLAPEKNLPFLARAVAAFLKERPQAWLLVAGVGPSQEEMEAHLAREGVLERTRFAGILQGRELVEAYAAMDVFAFASQSETQGIVLVEAMAAGVPVVAVDASGVREVVRDGVNGRLLPLENLEIFASALAWSADLPSDARGRLKMEARKTAHRMSMEVSSAKLETVYKSAARMKSAWQPDEDNPWDSAIRRIQTEWNLLSAMVHAAGSALVGSDAEESRPV